LVIWLHGHKNSFETSATHYAQIAADLNIDATFLTYDWTSNHSIFGYTNSAKQIADSATHLADLLDLIVNKAKPKKIIIIAHSLGCKLACEAFDKLHQKPQWSDRTPEFDHVVFLAPNVDKNDFDQRFKYVLMTMIKKLTVYVASNDDVLLLSKLFHNINSLGLPKEFLGNTNMDEIQALLYYGRLLPNKIDIIDTSYFDKKDFIGHFYFRERPVLTDLYALIEGTSSVNKRYLLKYDGHTQHAVDYWIIPP